MRRFGVALSILTALAAPAYAETCPGHPDAIGTSRTIAVDPATLPQIGRMQYQTSLPLEDHEVVLSFDDGPLPPYTGRILDILAENCVKADYFLVGSMASTYPGLVRRIYNAGHVIGTHSLDHPLTFNRMDDDRIAQEVEGGIAAVDAAVGDPRAVAPFFRVPGLLRSSKVDTFLAGKSLAVWSADEVADDWRHGITPKQIVQRALRRIERNDHRGVLLLHDIHPVTVRALPVLLAELKERGYHIVQAVPTGERPASVPDLPQKTVSAGVIGKASSSENSAKRAAHHVHKRRRHAHRRKSHREARTAKRRHATRSAEGGWIPLWR